MQKLAIKYLTGIPCISYKIINILTGDFMKLFLKKIISFLIAILMTVSYFPIGAFAFPLEETEETIEETEIVEEYTEHDE